MFLPPQSATTNKSETRCDEIKITFKALFTFFKLQNPENQNFTTRAKFFITKLLIDYQVSGTNISGVLQTVGDMIHTRLPTVSRTSVYNWLKSFVHNLINYQLVLSLEKADHLNMHHDGSTVMSKTMEALVFSHPDEEGGFKSLIASINHHFSQQFFSYQKFPGYSADS